nr:trypsin-like serine protease [Vibrio genomosp. F6]
MADVEVQPYIVNGTSASVDTFPSMASLFIDATDFGGGYSSGSYCGATILDSQHILTAAHCIYGDDTNAQVAQLFTVVVPQLQSDIELPNENIQSVRVKEVYYHSDYKNTTARLLPNDIAILKLESELIPLNSNPENDYVKFADDELYRSALSVFSAVGHGNTQSGVDESNHLLQTSLSYVSQSTCAEAFIGGRDYLTDNQICFTGPISNTTNLRNGTCQGDSGGPVYWYDGNAEVYKQVGVTSFGPSKCGNPLSNATSVFTELTNYKVWIDDVIAGNINSKITKIEITDVKRQSFADSGGLSTVSSSSGGGGGSLPLWSVFALGFIGLFRKQQR